jgi:quercetin dioxygenase-like cupin family protein
MKKINIFETGAFSDKGMSRNILHDSPFFKIINFNFRPGQTMPIHSHDIEGELSIIILDGEGEFLGKDGYSIPAKKGDALISEIREPHGIKAITELRVIVTIAPPI